MESDADIGITFTLRFKIEFDHFSREELVEETNPNSLQKTSTNGVHENGLPESEEDLRKDQTTVLVVEDNADLRAFIGKVLSEEYRVLSAANGEEGLELISGDLPDLIVADIMMPKVDSITFTITETRRSKNGSVLREHFFTYF